jgi:aquaporin Z
VAALYGRQRAATKATPGARLWAEALGTFALTLTACSVEAVAATHPELSHAERVVAPALAIVASIYALSDVSGAHFNPAVTLAFALRRAFPWRRVPGYVLAQLAAAVAGASVARLLAASGEIGATTPHVPAAVALALEVLLTFLLVSVILHTSERHGVVGPNAALAVGATISVCGFFGGPLTGASMNPARSWGPALVSGELGSAWIYAVGPVGGALLAVAVCHAVRGPASADERQAAQGESA